ncbi:MULTISPECIES: FecR family protein [Niastella]|uniref:FecR domain-containing protein n=1 Tax=Niastella soli TaxID=2821487 RepID=A0ABS3YLE0_9BACT|nr:FecR domain-containing protein [Niastella soli]MBO9198708.1 FecR domain-containing protein [Niastella soli]
MDNLEKQIQQFWENQTSAEQRREILRQLEESGMEWKEFMQQYYSRVLAGEEASGLNDEQKSRVWQRLHDQHLSDDNTGAQVIPIRRWRHLIKIAVAALVVITGTLVLYNSFTTRSATNAAGKPMVAQQPVVVNMVIRKNTKPGEDTLTLPDHSVVLLTPGSSIRYLEHFEAHARNIQLQGRALFEVTHDPTKPFTVTANGFATTALGTRFIVDGTKHVVSIRLLKGKIVVNATPDAGMALQKVYLTQGQELRINTATKHFDRIVTGIKQSPNKMTYSDNGTALSFEKTSLAVVFERLSKYYKTSILYDKAAIQDLSFTGDFSPADELDLALKVICNSNHLSFKKESDRIVISKQ